MGGIDAVEKYKAWQLKNPKRKDEPETPWFPQ